MPPRSVSFSFDRTGQHRSESRLTEPSLHLLAGCGTFGRDEGGGGFEFAQHHVDSLCALLVCLYLERFQAASELRDVLSSFSCRITRWSDLVTGDSTHGTPTQGNMVSTIDGLASPTPRGLAFA